MLLQAVAQFILVQVVLVVHTVVMSNLHVVVAVCNPAQVVPLLLERHHVAVPAIVEVRRMLLHVVILMKTHVVLAIITRTLTVTLVHLLAFRQAVAQGPHPVAILVEVLVVPAVAVDPAVPAVALTDDNKMYVLLKKSKL